MRDPQLPVKKLAPYVERNPFKPGRAEAVIEGPGVPVWAIVAYWQGVGDVKKVADNYESPLEVIEAALDYYRRNASVIDARIKANDAWSD